MLPLLLAVSVAVSSAETAPAPAGAVPLNDFLDHLYDPDGGRAVGDLMGPGQAGGSSRPAPGQTRFGFAPGVHWFRMSAGALPKGGALRLIEAGTPSMDRVSLHILWPDGRRSTMTAGDMQPYSSRAVPSRRLAFPLPEDLPPAATILIESGSEGPVRMPVRLWRTADFHAAEARDSAWLGLFAGVFVAMVLFNLVLYLSIRDPVYLAYVAFWSCFLLLQLTYRGVAQAVFWPDAAGVSNAVTVAALGGVVAFGGQFIRQFFGLRKRWPRGDAVFRFFLYAGIGGMVVSLLLPYALVLGILLGLAGMLLAASVWVVVAAWRDGFRPARFFAGASLVMTPGMVLFIGVSVGSVPESEWVLRFIQVCMMAEPFVFAVALADRITQMGASLREAEHRALRLREQFAIDLLRQQENSRRTIAGNLHDSVGQGLLVLLNGIKRLQRGGTASVDRALEEMGQTARETIDEVRAICHDLHPHQLERLGLDNALRSMLTGLFGGSGIDLTLDLAPTGGRLASDSEIHLFRLAQEAANNVLKHSGAANCEVVLRPAGDMMQLIVADDGRGLSRPAAGDPHFGGFGMTTMRERARAMGGTLALESAPREGVTLTALIPLSHGDAPHGAHHHRG